MTQGTVFSCAVAAEYVDCTVHGLIITARCDIANDKARVHSYLPIVSLSDWLHRDGRIILAERLLSETLGALRTTLKEAGYSPSILETESPQSIYKVLFSEDVAAPAVGRARVRFQKLCNQHEIAVKGTTSAPCDGFCVRIAQEAPKLKDNLLAELLHQRLSGYYFLDKVQPADDDSGQIVLLREVHSMSQMLANEVAEGLDAARFAEMCKASASVRGQLRILTEELAMPVGLMSSPYIEHLMQQFTLLFCRIGVRDPDPAYVKELCRRLPQSAGKG
jgi:hypothetical protein